MILLLRQREDGVALPVQHPEVGLSAPGDPDQDPFPSLPVSQVEPRVAFAVRPDEQSLSPLHIPERVPPLGRQGRDGRVDLLAGGPQFQPEELTGVP